MCACRSQLARCARGFIKASREIQLKHTAPSHRSEHIVSRFNPLRVTECKLSFQQIREIRSIFELTCESGNNMVLELEMSKTYQYRKVMKPMLERKRRARINKCLDELKDIMVECLTQEGEHITRLEKADILELTVEHMKKLRSQKQLRLHSGGGIAAQDAKITIAESFRAGYVHAANEVSKTLAAVPGVSVDLGTKLMSHLGHRLNYLQVVVPGVPVVDVASSVQEHQQPQPQHEYLQFQLASRSTNYFCDVSDAHSPIVVTPPPSECGSIDSGSCSPAPSESGSMWRPW